MFFKTIISTLAAASFVAGAPLQARAVVPHDSLNPLPEAIRTGTEGDGITRFEPLLHIAHGCQAYTAVGENGDTSGGLQDTGTSSGGCRDTTKGQTYVRAKWYNGRFGIMYSWYMPKDQPNDGDVAGGHRHDWEHVVVWVDDPAKETPTLLGAAASSHNSYVKSTDPQRNGDRVKVEYFTSFPLNHALQFTNTDGGEWPMIDWDVMPQAAKDGLENAQFGDANVPFKEANFDAKLEEAWV